MPPRVLDAGGEIMAEFRLKCPCTRDCVNRSATCHSECDAYKAYEREKHAEYAARAKLDAIDPSISPTVGMKRRMNHAKWLKKNGRWHK